MNPNEASKLIKEKEEARNKKKKERNLSNEKSFFSNLSKDQKKMLIITTTLILLLLFIIISIIIYIITNQPMNIYYRLLSKYPKPKTLPSDANTKYDKSLLNSEKICSENKKFAILRRTSCSPCGLFSYYIVHLGCIINYLKHGYIPILETGSFINVFTGKNLQSHNPWENFFNQPCGYTFDEVVRMKDVEVFECVCVGDMPDEKTVYNNSIMWDYHHQIQNKYMSIKKEVYLEADKIWKNFFGESKNILGILLRGTDYTSRRPPEHAIPPKTKLALNDTIKMDKKYKYDFIFIATEDNIIRRKFNETFGNRLKYLIPEKQVFYNYKVKNFLTFNYKVFGNMNHMKTYLISIIILSKCQDIISARTSGAAGAFILSNGFRNSKVYYLGEY